MNRTRADAVSTQAVLPASVVAVCATAALDDKRNSALVVGAMRRMAECLITSPSQPNVPDAYQAEKKTRKAIALWRPSLARKKSRR
jgi:hypothetical protein